MTELPVYFLSDQLEPINITDRYGIYWIYVPPADRQYTHLSRMGYPGKDFWCLTAKRLWYLADFIAERKFNNTIHFENDVLLYVDPLNHLQTFQDEYSGLAITRGTYLDCMTGFSYSRNYGDWSEFTKYAENLLNNPNLVQNEQYEMLHEMALLGTYERNVHDSIIATLPSLPFGDLSRGLDTLRIQFDPASWGQYALGTHSKPVPGWAEHKHFIGHEILRGSVDLQWDVIDGMRKPFVLDKVNQARWPLANLHVHSKRLNLGISKKI